MPPKKTIPDKNEMHYSQDIFEIEGYPDLIQQLRKENAEALKHIYKTYSEDLLIMAFMHLGGTGLAVKAVSQLFKQLQHREQWVHLPSGIYPFLCDQLKICCLDLQKSIDTDIA